MAPGRYRAGSIADKASDRARRGGQRDRAARLSLPPPEDHMASRADGATATGGVHRHRARTPAQWYCTIIGAVLTLVGILGFIANSSFGHGGHVQGDNLVIFEVNGWHNLVHLASGLFLLAMSPKRRTAKTAALAFGIVYGLVAIWGLVDGNDVLGLVPVNPADNVLHILLAALGIITGAVSDKDDWDTEQGSLGGRAGHKVA